MASLADRAAPRASDAIGEVREGLSRAQKELPPKFFYDERGSRLFEEITRLPEYYLTRAERTLLERWVTPVVETVRPATLVELGAGSAAKTRLVLDAMRASGTARAYVPIDVSAEFLAETARDLRRAYPGLAVHPMVADISEPLSLDRGLPSPMLIAFLGSTIGNFAPEDAARLLGGLGDAMQDADRLLLGVDLRKDVAVIERAYNDAAGVTAEFNRNMLRVLNASLGADFDVDAFEHRAFYAPVRHRIEMHLVATRAMTVTIPGMPPVAIRAGETIRTEISRKYDRASVDAMLGAAGMRLERWLTNEASTFALVVARRA